MLGTAAYTCGESVVRFRYYTPNDFNKASRQQ